MSAVETVPIEDASAMDYGKNVVQIPIVRRDLLGTGDKLIAEATV